MFKLVDVRDEASLKTRAYTAGRVYVCSKTKRIYYDSVANGKRILVNATVTLQDDEERLSMLEPSEHVIYFVLSTRSFYTYKDEEWIPATDDTLSVAGIAADSKAVGEAIAKSTENANKYTDEAIAAQDEVIRQDMSEAISEASEENNKYTDKAIENLSDAVTQEFLETSESIKAVDQRIDDLIGEPITDLDTIERISKKSYENAQNIAMILRSQTGGSTYIGPEPPAEDDVVYGTWIDTSGEYSVLKFKDLETGEWINVVSSKPEVGSNVFVGINAPTNEDCTVWIDLSGTAPLLKFKNNSGTWVTVSGGGGGTTGGEGGSTSAGSEIYVGAEPPASGNMWIDTSDTHPCLKYLSASGEWLVVGAKVTEGSTLFVGDEAPADESINTWIDTSKDDPYLKYKDGDGTWNMVAGKPGAKVDDKSVYIGAEAPPTTDYQLWVDNSREIPFLKYYKTDTKEWVSISGGGGTGGGPSGPTNTAELTVLNLGGWLAKTISVGTDCIIELQWSSINQGISTGNGTCSIMVDDVVKRVYEVQQGQLNINVKSYLKTGSNKIKITISDMYGNYTDLMFNVTTISVSISSYFDQTMDYSNTSDLSFTYTPVGECEKTVYFILNDNPDILSPQTTSASNTAVTYVIPAQEHGRYTLEVYFIGNIDGQTVESNHLYYEFAWREPENTEVIITIPYNNLKVSQYDTIPFTYQVRGYGMTTDIELLVNDEVVQQLEVGTKLQTWSYRTYEPGELELGIRCGTVYASKVIQVTKSNINVSAESNGLELMLRSSNRSNMEANPGKWEYNDISAEMTGFNYASNGWVLDDDKNTVLRLNGDARVNIPFNIFAGDLRQTGKTIEIEFATRDVLNYDAVVISTMSAGRGINITAQKATLTSEQCEIFTQYKEEETVRLAFTIESRAENRLLGIYINGILSGLTRYPDNDNFAQSIPVGITIGSNDCTTDIYSIRVYSNALTSYQVVNNWIADTQNIDLMLDRYERNKIFDAYGNVTIGNLPKDLPYMVFYVTDYSKLPQYKGDKKTISGYYVDPVDPSRSFSWEDGQMNVQGTSSAGYSRKNYKLKFKNGLTMTSTGEFLKLYTLREGLSIPTVEFCLKADVASSEGANNVELVKYYNDICPAYFPPRDDDSRARMGIEGYPMVCFYGEKDGKMNFLGKYNFNNDKGTNEVYGLGDDDQSWEIVDNSSDLVIWKDDDLSGMIEGSDGEMMPKWKTAFEARHPEDSEEISDLQALSTWIKSTDTTVEGLSEEEKKARLEKFKNEFEDWFNKDSMIFNYIFTEMFLMVDNRAKNAFPTKYGEDNKWLILPYDYDTAIGISNTGELKFGYELEDIDRVDGAFVYNGQDSVLYVNIRECFFDDIRAMYQTLRSIDEPYPFSYEEIAGRFHDHQAVWGESIYNEDARFKYIEPTVKDGETMYLPMVQGSKEEQRKWWLYNRFRYLDSKYSAGDSENDGIFIRNYSWGDITVTPYADIYATVDFDSNRRSVRAFRGNSYIIKDPRTLVDKEMVTEILSASQLSDVGDLSHLQCGRVSFTAAKKLRSLKVGDSSPDYENLHLTELTFESMPLLRTLDISNCKNFKQTLDFSTCTNIEHIYAEGTQITGLVLPDGGIVKTLHLPTTVKSLQIVNQMWLTDLKFTNYDSLESIWLEKVDWTVFNADEILDRLKDGTYVRLIGVEWTMDTIDEIREMMDKLDRFHGINEDGSRPDKAVIGGVIHTKHITGDEKDELYLRYPDLEIDAETIVCKVEFVVNGEVVHTIPEVWNYGSVEDPITAGIIETPTREEDEVGRYTYKGWSESLENIAWNLKIQAMFTEDKKYYVSFIDANGDIIQVNGQDSIPYFSTEGENVVTFPTEVPEIPFTKAGINYIRRFDHWENANGETITSLTIYGGRTYQIKIYAKYTEHRVWVITFKNYDDSDHVIRYNCTGENFEMPSTPTKPSTYWENYVFDGWSLDGKTTVVVPTLVGEENITYKAIYHAEPIYHTITFMNGDVEVSKDTTTQYGDEIVIPADPTKESDNTTHYTFAFWSLDGETAAEITTVGETDLTYVAVYTPSVRYYTVEYYNGDVFLESCQVEYEQDAPYEGDMPTNENDETFVGWEPSNLKVTENRKCQAKFVYYLTHRFLRRTLVEVDSQVPLVAAYAFDSCADLVSVNLPNAIEIGIGAFQKCTSLKTVNLPNMSSTIPRNAFTSCTSLESLSLPYAVSIFTQSLYRCNNLKRLEFEYLEHIPAGSVSDCTSLDTLILRNAIMVTIDASALNGTLIGSTGYVYVPTELYETYCNDTNWSAYKDSIRIIEEWPDICG